MRRLLPALLAALTITWTAGAAVADPDLAEPDFEYVALGDSSAAGPLIPQQDPEAPGCMRSSRNWPSVLAERIGARLTDVTCSGAVTDDLTGSQTTIDGESQAPQADALSPSTDLVTLTLGGNDIALVDLAGKCVNLLPQPIGRSCRDEFTAGGRDELAERIDAYAAEFAAALDLISDRAPGARVVVVGYGTHIRPEGCHPEQPIWPKDAAYLQGGIHRLNELFAREAAEHGALYVDVESPSVGHDACAPSAQKWFEGVVVTGPVAPLHPNKAGMAAVGGIVADRL
ncbi:SGNH/GDSL hydrolase family protein [Saccharothrix texasensis]|uniref:Lysophospholipase L1-like esterase n=1 Tax=Saccharothrix texasensis TaxID=103734 RepID=A0A3N1H5R6_9PSEU|nr:SGNH/GDSL hydrolase family protein [Saccharothrix texasensis]ROP37766.1 lysophospholipase L1-like esterase [Saccharothrix texasensis]